MELTIIRNAMSTNGELVYAGASPVKYLGHVVSGNIRVLWREQEFEINPKAAKETQ